MILRQTLVLAVVGGAVLAARAPAQTTTPSPTPPRSQTQLDQVREALRMIDVSPQTDAGRRIVTLKDDFAELAGTYLIPSSRPVDRAGAAPAAVGTSGATSAVDAGWRAKYRDVENDLAALIGPSDPPSKDAQIVQLDPRIRRQLEDIRARLRSFYAGTMSAPGANPVAHTGVPPAISTETPTIAPPVAPTGAAPLTPPPVAPSVSNTPAVVSGTSPIVDRDMGTAIALLDRIQRIVDDATKNPMGKVSIDRQALDEIRADVAQIKTSLLARRQ